MLTLLNLNNTTLCKKIECSLTTMSRGIDYNLRQERFAAISRKETDTFHNLQFLRMILNPILLVLFFNIKSGLLTVKFLQLEDCTYSFEI